MIKIFKIILICILCINICFAKIIKTNDFCIIENNVKNVNDDTLVIFDVDNVLLQPKDQLLKHYYEKFMEFYKDAKARLNPAQADELYSLMLIQRQIEPVDNNMVKLINKTQKNGIKVLALTHCYIKPFGKISSIEDWRIKELKRLGYYFDKSWNKLKNKELKPLLSKDSTKNSVFKQGIVFTNGHSKGDALKSFLNYAGFMPKKILFIDDRRKFLESVETFAQKSGIEFLGIEYTVVEDSKVTPLNKKRSQLQLDTLEKEHKWLSDQEADAQIKRIK